MRLSNLTKLNIYLSKVNNRNIETGCEICSNLTIKIPEQRHWRRLDVFMVNSEHISHLIVGRGGLTPLFYEDSPYIS